MHIQIAVLIPHYNNIKGLCESLESISNTETVDVVVVDDGSEIKPNQKELKDQFPYIHNIIVLSNENNRGIEAVLNDGLRYIKEHDYKYIARLDCGDLCREQRFKYQKEYLDNHSNVDLVGGWVSFVDLSGKELFVFRPETAPEKIGKQMYISNQFTHPAIMFRTEAIEQMGYYPTNYPAAEDYAYFFRFVTKLRTANIPEILIDYEINPAGISLSKRKKQIASRLRVILDNFDFSLYAIYGLVRNTMLYFLPYSVIEALKSCFKK